MSGLIGTNRIINVAKENLIDLWTFDSVFSNSRIYGRVRGLEMLVTGTPGNLSFGTDFGYIDGLTPARFISGVVPVGQTLLFYSPQFQSLFDGQEVSTVIFVKSTPQWWAYTPSAALNFMNINQTGTATNSIQIRKEVTPNIINLIYVAQGGTTQQINLTVTRGDDWIGIGLTASRTINRFYGYLYQQGNRTLTRSSGITLGGGVWNNNSPFNTNRVVLGAVTSGAAVMQANITHFAVWNKALTEFEMAKVFGG